MWVMLIATGGCLFLLGKALYGQTKENNRRTTHGLQDGLSEILLAQYTHYLINYIFIAHSNTWSRVEGSSSLVGGLSSAGRWVGAHWMGHT